MTVAETSTPETSTPTLECPSWCHVRHERHDGLDGFTSHQLHRDIDPAAPDTGYVTLFMSDYGTALPELECHNGGIDIHLSWPGSDRKSVIRPLEEAEDFAGLAEAFGREDIAAIIREVAEMGRNTVAAKAR